MDPEPPRRGPWRPRLLIASTSLRILLTPPIMALVIAGGEGRETIAAVLFAAAAVTDWVDGRMARRWGLASPLGAFLDLTADKVLVAGVLFALVDADRVSPWLAAIIVARELLILGLRSAVAVRGTVVAPSLLGKSKTTAQFVAILLAIIRPGEELAGMFIDEWAMLAAVAITVASGADYIARFASRLRADAADPPPG